MAAARHRHNGTADQQRQSIDHPTFNLSLDPASLEALAERVADLIADRLPDPEPERVWLGMGEAAIYLGTTRDGLRKLTAARQIEFSQTTAGAPCYFRREWLDDYRERHLKGGRN